MAPPARRAFAHRDNPGGTTDSICRQCFATVGTSAWEAELERAELDHKCDPGVLRQWDEYAKGQRQRPEDSDS